MEVTKKAYDTDLSLKLASLLDYSLNLEELILADNFVDRCKIHLEEIEQLYHDGRVLQVGTLCTEIT
jgi:hypothetical protein